MTQTAAERIQACFDCAQACTADADADLGEQQVQTMIRCIRLCLDCADVCRATGGILSRRSPLTSCGARRPGVRADCKVCGDECGEHARHGFVHCQTRLEACRRCEQACNAVHTVLPARDGALSHRNVLLPIARSRG